MTDRPSSKGGRSYRSRQEALEEWLKENVRYYEAKEQVTLFGFDVSFSWDSDTCGSFYVKFDDEACPMPLRSTTR